MKHPLWQIKDMMLKIIELQSKFKKPTLKRVKISAEAMLSVLLGSKHKESIDFKANLKKGKKEEEKVRLEVLIPVMIRIRIRRCLQT